MVFLLVLLAIAALIIWIAINAYNSLATYRQRYKNAYAQIDVQLRRRHDLIPNLVEAVKGYMSHERETLEAVINARNMAVNATQSAARSPGDARSMQQLGEAEALLTGTLGRLFALAEAYPDLKADRSMSDLTEELRSTENRIAFARQAFNDAITLYNTKRDVFPSNLVAGMFNFAEAQLLEENDPAVKAVPKVSF
ncbi:MAG: LemA family protein [Cyanobacteria bacterium P01_G01_bin.54]